MDKNKKLFPQRLWELIHDEKYNFCLRWSPDGQRVYLNRNDFETHYLKTSNNQFHTQKAISFVRQMNMYGFRKVDDCYYENDNFKRNCHHLLKNMVRRHSNKGFFTPSSNVASDHQHNHQASQHNNHNNHHHHHHNQQQQQQNHRHGRDSNNQSMYHPDNQDLVSDSARIAAAAAERQATQYLRDAGASVGNIGAAMAAALNSVTSRSPLASTLYHRLAAMNFGNQQIDANQQQQQQQQQIIREQQQQQQHVTGLTEREPQNQDSNGSVVSHNRLSQHQNQFDTLDIPMSSHQSLAARQAIQQNLVRSYLQLKQPQHPLSLQQNLLASLQQQNPTLLLESLASLSSVGGFISSSLQDQGPSVSPLELVVNSVSNVTTPDHDQTSQYLRFSGDNSSVLNSTESSNMTNINRSLFDQMNDEEDIDNGECEIDFEGDDGMNRNGSFLGNHSSSSSSNHEATRYPLDQDDSSNAILDLAKPSSTRSNGRQKMSRTSE